MLHFYCYASDKKIVISDFPTEKVKLKHGYRFEILNSLRDKTSLTAVKDRVLRPYTNFTVIEWIQRERKPISAEARLKISLSKLGKPRDEATRKKISAKLKGKSNFQGKRHNDETKKVMAEKKLGNDHVKETVWAFDPRGTKEVRVRDLKEIPKGFSKGRDYYSTEPGLEHFKARWKTSTL